MNWEAAGAIGEIVGALAVFLTLAYLAIQIRQNTSTVRATALDSSVNAVANAREKILIDADIAKIFIKGGNNPEELDETDLLRYRILMTNILWSIWNLYSQLNYAGLSQSVWNCQKPTIRRLMCTTGGKWYWSEYSSEFEDSFAAEIDSIINNYDSVS